MGTTARTRTAVALIGAAAIAGSATLAHAAPQSAHQAPASAPAWVVFEGAPLPVIPANYGHSPQMPTTLYLADGSPSARVVASPASEGRMSADGRRVAYLASGSGSPAAVMVSIDGAAPVRVARARSVVGWSPNSRRLLLQASSTTFRVFTFSDNGRVAARTIPTKARTRYQRMVWETSSTFIANGWVRNPRFGQLDPMWRVRLGNPRTQELAYNAGQVLASNTRGWVLLIDDGEYRLYPPRGLARKVGTGAFAVSDAGRVLAVRNVPGVANEEEARLVEVDTGRRSTRVIMESVRAAGASQNGQVIAVQRSVWDANSGYYRWVISTVDRFGTLIKNVAIVGDTTGAPAEPGTSDNPTATLVPSRDGQAVLIGTPFIHGG